MDAKAKPIRDILYADVQFVVPFFQRWYSWGRPQWERLQTDIWNLLDESRSKKHFLGPLVCAALPAFPGEAQRFQLIDGQQRLTTLSLMLTAIRDVAMEKGLDELAAEVHEMYLIHRFKKGLAKFKILPRSGDREAFQALVDESGSAPDTPTRALVEAYNYFRKLLRNESSSDPTKLRNIFDAVVAKLYLVVISLDEEDPYEIFESLNSTGLPLQEADLIRNFLFMKLPLEEHAEFQEECWKGFEKEFDSVDGFAALPATSFYRDYLMRDGRYSKAHETFIDFKEYFQERDWEPRQAVKELACYVRFAQGIARNGFGLEKTPALALRNFAAMEATTANPLILNLMDRRDKKQITEDGFVGCIEDLTSFVMRRSICGENTRAYGRWFCEAAAQLGDHPREQLQAYLLHRGWPDDKAFVRQLIEFPLYHREFAKCRVRCLADFRQSSCLFDWWL